MKRPLISICVTVYNLEKYIEQCLSSIMNQSFDDFEVVLVDNGSEDKSIEICEEFARRFSDKINFIKLPPPTVLGRSGQVSVMEAKGHYIQIVDGDDFLADGYLKDIAEIIYEKQPSVILGSFKCVVEDGAIAIHDAIIEADQINNVSRKEALQYLFSLPNFHKTQWRCIVKRDAVNTKKLGKKELGLVGVYGDMIGVAIWLLGAEKLYYYDKPFYYYRCRATGNMSTQMHTKSTGDFLKGIIQLKEWIVAVESKNIIQVDFESSELMLNLLLKLFLSGADVISTNEMEALGQLLDKHKMAVLSLDQYKSNRFKNLATFVYTYGGREGLKYFIEDEQRQKIDLVNSVGNKKIYIFPMGIYSVGISRILRNAEFNLAGFLDNDITKQGKSFDGIPCLSPKLMTLKTDLDKDESVILISTIYDKLVPKLTNQIYEMGYTNIRIV